MESRLLLLPRHFSHAPIFLYSVIKTGKHAPIDISIQ